jgi:toxin YoeB
MKKIWFEEAWDEYVYWQAQDRKTLKKINKLLDSIDRNGYGCIGKPEPLKYDLQGFWSVEIDKKNRIVFRIIKANKEDNLEIVQCGSHYKDK